MEAMGVRLPDTLTLLPTANNGAACTLEPGDREQGCTFTRWAPTLVAVGQA